MLAGISACSDGSGVCWGQEGGAAIGVEEWAGWHGCSALEMLCSVGGRLPVLDGG